MVEVIGVMTLTAIDRLIEEKVFGPDSPVKNLSNMLGLIVDWNELVNEGMMDSFTESSSWVRRVVELAETHGVPITYPEGVEKYIKKVKEAGDAPKKWKTMTWKKKVSLGSRSRTPVVNQLTHRTSILNSRRSMLVAPEVHRQWTLHSGVSPRGRSIAIRTSKEVADGPHVDGGNEVLRLLLCC